MDRFYVPAVRDPAAITALFDLIADLYDSLVGYATNLDMARRLLRAVLEVADHPRIILDFGCGTGVAHQALQDFEFDAKVVGTDLSGEMLRNAMQRGEAVVTIDQWRRDTRLYDGAIASFVLHYGVAVDDLKKIASSLRVGGRFAANFFKANEVEVGDLIATLADVGLRLIRQEQPSVETAAANPILVFERVAS
ncbi:MAG: methyltransferase domain-containing protein [Phenylobacterium sp.]|nr:methyltransferase domain-containing protein [Phenylobacterium sp.]